MALSYKRFENITLYTLMVIYVLSSLLQFVAILRLLLSIGLSRIVSFCIASILAYIPFIGTVIGAFAAKKVWSFSLLKICILFSPISIAIVFVSTVLFLSRNKPNSIN